MSFETDNQDKSNLVGDAKLMSDAVDREQELLKRSSGFRSGFEERLALVDEVRELKDEVRELEFNMGENHLSYQTQIVNLTKRAKAWDDLETLLKSDKDMVSLGFAKYEGEPLVKYNGVFYGCSTIAEGVSRALASTKGES